MSLQRRALCLLRDDIAYRRDAFCRGLASAGFTVTSDVREPRPDDALVIWNRYGKYHEEALRFEAAGARVVVAENGYLGKEWLGAQWFSLALSHHAGAGQWFPLGADRWDSFGASLAPFRENGNEALILGQRGIGESGIASPAGWEQRTQRQTGARIRVHPDLGVTKRTLADDLQNASCVITWASSAALTALLMGVPVFYEFPRWIGAYAGLPVWAWGEEPLRDEHARLAMFRKLAWSIWRTREIERGDAFAHLLRRGHDE